MNNQKTFGSKQLLLLLAIILPIIYFGYVITYSTLNSGYVPKYNLMFISDNTSKDCSGQNIKTDPTTGVQTVLPQKKIVLENNKLSVITTTEQNYDYPARFCDDSFYVYDVTNNINKKINIDMLPNYELTNDKLSYNDNKKDPDGFEFRDGAFTNNVSPFFYEGYKYDKPVYSLSKQFSNKIIKVDERVRFLGFIKK